MKKISLWLITLWMTLCLAPAMAAESGELPAEAKQSALSLLTEVYGYTAEEADNFAFRCEEADGQWMMTFAPKAHPGWQYTAAFSAQTGAFISGETPFGVSAFSYYPGEATVRDGLRAAREKGWFTAKDEAAAADFAQWLEQWNVRPNAALQGWLYGDGVTAAQAVDGYFTSCYGEEYQWPAALKEWRDEELAAYGFTLEAPKAPAQGSRVYLARSRRLGDLPLTVTEFSTQAPEIVAPALAVPQLEGWRCLCGVYVAMDRQAAGTRFEDWPDRGLIAFEKDGQRLLTAVMRTAEGESQLYPIGDKALLTDRELTMTFDAQSELFKLVYPLSATERESFAVTLLSGQYGGVLCRLENYTHVNDQTNEALLISRQSQNHGGEESWYYVNAYQNGVAAAERVYLRNAPPYLNFIDADHFPKTAEACEAETGFTLPEDYGVACDVHLRAKTSSHSKDLGMYRMGVLVQVLGTEPGSPYTWYHVRVGSAEGYMSGIYVDYPGAECGMKPLSQFEPLTVGKTKKAVALKKGTGWFDGTIMQLSAGTKLHVMADTGGWLHVMIPTGDIGWMMDINGTDGYVRAGDVALGATALQLDWME